MRWYVASRKLRQIVDADTAEEAMAAALVQASDESIESGKPIEAGRFVCASQSSFFHRDALWWSLEKAMQAANISFAHDE